MSAKAYRNEVSNSVAIMATTSLHVKGVEEEVIVVAKKTGNEGEVADPVYYQSPLIARTAFEDLEKGVDVLTSFAGRDEADMIAHLAKNRK
jgi:hypothetical protein